jgi:RNA polymerase sigma-70 factor (family 1)
LEQYDETILLRAMQGGDESAFDRLFRTYYAPLCRYARSMTEGDLDEAEDIVQQIFVKVWEQREHLEVQWSLKAYLYKMVHHRCLNRLRDARIRERYKVHNATQLEHQSESIPGAAAELGARIQNALAALPTECRRVFELSRFEELKYREIADQLGISIKTVETQMGKALRIMRTELADYLVAFLLIFFGKLF